MNKKVIILIIVVIVILLIIGGIIINNKQNNKSTNNLDNNTSSNDTNNNEESTNDDNSKSVVIYFSATGTTENVAKTIASVTNSDIIEIEPKEEYTSEDLNYNSDCRANREQNDDSVRPEIKNKFEINEYDTIYLGYPIWWGTNPKIILTLLDNYDLTGKNIYLFCTSGSSGIETSEKEIKEYNSNLNIISSKRFSSSTSENDVKEWLNN